jgi:hypothetical protein
MSLICLRKPFGLILLLSAVGVSIFWMLSMNEDDYQKILTIGRAKLKVELASTSSEIQLGLSYREKLAEDHGMLFIMSGTRIQYFWMKDMKFPLDMIFISNMQVVEIRSEIPAPIEGQDGREIKVVSSVPADMVLEVNSGWSSVQGIKVGDAISLSQ